MLNSFISLLSIILFAYSLHTFFKINASITPLISLTSLISIAVLLSLFNMLFVGVIFAHILSVAFFIFAIIKNKSILLNSLKQFFTVGVVLFIFSSLCMLIVLYINKPLLIGWDEFSFWGTSHKLVHTNNALYTFYDSSLIGRTTPPTLAVLSYFFQNYSGTYTEWISFFAYDVMFFAAFSSFTAVFKKHKWSLSVLMFLTGFFIPYFFSVYAKTINLISVYVDTYADIPLGIIFAACFAVYFFEENESTKLFCLLPVIFFLTLIKDMGFALSCIVVFVIFIHLLFNKKQYQLFVFKNLIAKLIFVVLLFLCTFLAFIGWAAHMGAVMQVNRFNLGGQQNIGMVTMLTTGILELFSPVKSEKFSTIFNYMLSALFTNKVSMIGSGFVVILLIIIIFTISFLLGNKQGKIRSLSVFIAAFIGFIGYYIFHIFLYVYIFKENGYYLPSYNRYIFTYYVGFLLLAIFILCININENNKYNKVGTTIFIVFFIGVFTLFQYNVNKQHIFISANESFYTIRYEVKEKINCLQSSVESEDVIYFNTANEDYGFRWFIFAYEYIENIFVSDMPMPEQNDLTDEEYTKLVRQDLINYFKQNNVTHLMLDSNSAFAQTYFTNDVQSTSQSYSLHDIAYYELTFVNNNDIELYLVEGGDVDND